MLQSHVNELIRGKIDQSQQSNPIIACPSLEGIKRSVFCPVSTVFVDHAADILFLFQTETPSQPGWYVKCLPESSCKHTASDLIFHFARVLVSDAVPLCHCKDWRLRAPLTFLDWPVGWSELMAWFTWWPKCPSSSYPEQMTGGAALLTGFVPTQIIEANQKVSEKVHLNKVASCCTSWSTTICFYYCFLHETIHLSFLSDAPL